MNFNDLQPDTLDGSSSAKSLTSHAYEQIRSDILWGKLKPSERLRINSLAERYEVGPTAVREALSRLLNSELVQIEDQRGFSVSPVSKADLVDLTQTRVDVESIALERAIQKGDIEWESGVISAFHRLSKIPADPNASPADLAPWATAHQQFHMSLLTGCRSPWLLRLVDMLYDKSDRYRNIAYRQGSTLKHDIAAEERSRNVLQEHRALMEAVIARDAPKAKALLAEHFWTTTNIILQSELGDAPPSTSKRFSA